MAIQQWLSSFKGRIGHRDSWIWIDLRVVGMPVLFSLAGKRLLDIQTAAFCLVCLLWPTTVVTVKRLHDRGCSGACALLMILARMLLAGNRVMLPGVWQQAIGRFVPALILVGTLIDLGVFIGIQDTSKHGKDTQDVKYRVGS